MRVWPYRFWEVHLSLNLVSRVTLKRSSGRVIGKTTSFHVFGFRRRGDTLKGKLNQTFHPREN